MKKILMENGYLTIRLNKRMLRNIKNIEDVNRSVISNTKFKLDINIQDEI